jgi:hypothetical protein
VHRAWQNRAPYDNHVARGLAFERLADLLTNPPRVPQVEIVVGLARCADANDGQFRW